MLPKINFGLRQSISWATHTLINFILSGIRRTNSAFDNPVASCQVTVVARLMSTLTLLFESEIREPQCAIGSIPNQKIRSCSKQEQNSLRVVQMP